MTLWAYPGVVTAPIYGNTFTADLDLGLRWRHTTLVRVAGIRPQPGSTAADILIQALPVGATFTAYAQRIGHQDTLVAHIVTPGADTDLVSRIRGRRSPLPEATYGAQPGKTWRYPATTRRVVDADTIWCCIDMGCPTTHVAPVRVIGVDALETGAAAGIAASTWVKQALPPGTPVTVTSRILDKYGRPLGDVTLPDGTSLGQALLATGRAKEYDGHGPR